MGISSYSATPSSNTVINGINISEGCPPSGINDAIRQLMADLATDCVNKNTAQSLAAQLNFAQGANIASATTTDIGAATGNFVNVTGTTTITGFGTIAAGAWRIVKFTEALTLTYNATSLILPGAANITTAAGDIGAFISLGSGNWQCTKYTRIGGISTADIANSAVTNAKIATGSVTPDRLSTGGLYWDTSGNVGIGTTTLGSNDFLVSENKPAGNVQSNVVNTDTGGTSGSYVFATQGSVVTVLGSYGNVIGQAGTATGSNFPFQFLTNGVERGRFDTSGNFLFNSGYGSVATAYGCRAWVNFNGTGTVSIRGSGNVSSITDNGTGDYTVNFSTAMPDIVYAGVVSAGNGSLSGAFSTNIPLNTITTTAFRIGITTVASTPVLIDAGYVNAAFFR